MVNFDARFEVFTMVKLELVFYGMLLSMVWWFY